MRCVMVAFLCIALGAPAAAQSPQAVSLLQAITVEIDVENPATGQGDLCHGFVAGVSNGDAYVVTAKHCLSELVTDPSSPAASTPSGLAIDVKFPDGTRGRVHGVAWGASSDAAVLVTSVAQPPASLADCEQCRVYGDFGRGRQIAVLSILSAGGGPPVVSSGVLISDQSGRYLVVLPASPGTSGAAILDLNGNLIGMVVTVGTVGGAEAGSIAGIVPGATVEALVRYAVSQAGTPPQPGPALSPAGSPPAVAAISGTWSGTWQSGQNGERGAFSAALSLRGGATVVGVVTLQGNACFAELQVAGPVNRTTTREDTYELTGYADGAARAVFEITVSNGTLSGSYTAQQTGSACDGTSGSIMATVQ